MFAREIGFETREGTAVSRELGYGQTCFKIAEECRELLPL
jgi:hypothetical protein